MNTRGEMDTPLLSGNMHISAKLYKLYEICIVYERFDGIKVYALLHLSSEILLYFFLSFKLVYKQSRGSGGFILEQRNIFPFYVK